MKLSFHDSAMRKRVVDPKLAKKHYGAERAKRLAQRLDDLGAVTDLESMRTLPGRCHEHRGTASPVLTVDLDGPYRLYFKPDHDPVPLKPDGGLDWAKVTAIRILRIDDPHGA